MCCFSSVFTLVCLFFAEVPAQPADFEAEAELDSRVLLSWLWPVQDHIISFELRYWEDNNPAVQVMLTGQKHKTRKLSSEPTN